MQTIRGFLVAVLWLGAIVTVAVMLDALADARVPEVAHIEGLLCALILTVVIAAAYIASAIDEAARRIVPGPVQPQVVQPPQQGYPQQ